MKKTFLALSAMTIAGCTSDGEQLPSAGMANPASVYCVKLGGTSERVKTPGGEGGYCTLPSGERIEEWTLYRRDHK
jgi:Putative hemolysin